MDEGAARGVARGTAAPLVYCLTDEAALLASWSLLPIVRAFLGAFGASVTTVDVSLGARILGRLSEWIPSGRRIGDPLAELVAWCAEPVALIKPPGISADLSQLEAAVEELQRQGSPVPPYPRDPKNADAVRIRDRYDELLGSEVNTALRRGNSVRRVPATLKARARQRPSPAVPWAPDCRSLVATMREGDFRSTEQAITVARPGKLQVVHVRRDESAALLGQPLRVAEGDVVDAAVMRRAALERFLLEELQSARQASLLFALELKCTTMRVADPLVFRAAVRAYRSLEATEAGAPALAMDEMAPGRSTLHAPGGTSVAAAMSAAILEGGRALDAAGVRRETKFVIPDHAYAPLFEAVFESCRASGLPDPRTMGSATVVGLSADAAEEYGSQDTTWEIDADGEVRVVDDAGTVLVSHAVGAGDIYRLCATSDAALRDWLALGLEEARRTSGAAVFWLDASRPRDRQVIAKLRDAACGNHDVAVMDVRSAAGHLLARLRAGEDVVAIVGNVLRDYLAAVVAALETGRGSGMTATTRLPRGGRLFETGSSGCAPDHVRQLLASNHLRWSSHGEVAAIASALEWIGASANDPALVALAAALERAGRASLTAGHAPSRVVGALDTRGSHYYLARMWAEEMAREGPSSRAFAELSEALHGEEATILRELRGASNVPVDLGGYYRPDPTRLSAVMRPSEAFNRILSAWQKKVARSSA